MNASQNRVNLESSSVVDGKSRVAKKALAELIATKWKSVNKVSSEPDRVITQPTREVTKVETQRPVTVAEINSYKPVEQLVKNEPLRNTVHSRVSKGRRTNTSRNVTKVSSKVLCILLLFLSFVIYYVRIVQSTF